MKRNVGDLVWIPENSFLFWQDEDKQDKVARRCKTTIKPDVAVVVSEVDAKNYCILINGDYWLIDKQEIYEVPNVLDSRCS